MTWSDVRTLDVVGSEGAILSCAHTPLDAEKKSVVIVLPFGVPARLAQAPFRRLGSHFNVVTWESRFVLALERQFSDDEKLTPFEHAEDMLCVLRALGIARCRLIGYCSGAGIALLATRLHPEVVDELVLVNGEYQLFRRGHVATEYQRSIDAFLPVVATSRQQARFIFAKMSEISRASKAGALADPDLDRLVNRPFSAEETLYRYAKNYVAYRDFDALAVAEKIEHRTLVVAGDADQHASAENSKAVQERIAGPSAFVEERGDHYAFCRDGSSSLERISTYLCSRLKGGL